MSNRMRRILICISLAVLLLSGCGKDDVPTVATSDYEAELVYGVFEADKLEVLPWNSGRCESTMANAMAETENGYYFVHDHYLYYADKTNLTNWVLVCNKPNCPHYENDYLCNAKLDEDWVVLQDGRLYYAEARGEFELPIKTSGMGNLIVSTALDGTDKKLAYVIEDSLLLSAGTAGGRFIGGQWLYMKSSANEYGNIETRLFILDENGEKEVEVPDGTTVSMYRGSDIAFLRGDPYFLCGNFSNNKFLRFQGDELVGFDMKYLPETGGFISGTTLRIFKENKGYFDIDVTTGKQVKIADNRIKNSAGFILAPNCVIESNAFGFTYEKRSVPVQIEVFDGESWRSVRLPEEWQNPTSAQWLHVLGITSDSILLYARDEETFYGIENTSTLYRIPLDSEELVMEYCFTFPISDDKA